jgi:hypothetical protein
VFSVYCPGHAARVLLDTSRLWRLEGGDGRYELHWVCWCGHEGVLPLGDPKSQEWLTAS